VLVTGGTGFTGRLLVERLRQDGRDVIALSHDATGPDTQRADLRDFDGLVELFSALRPHVVVHLAGIAAPSHDKVDEIYEANVIGTANLFAALLAKRIEPRLVVVASSAQVYRIDNSPEPLTEDSPLLPKSHYGVSKRAAEDIAGLYLNHFPVVIARPFNYTGPEQPKNFIVPKIVQHYAERRSEIRVGNLDLFRDISDVRRTIEAYARLVSGTIAPTTVNICSGRAVYLGDIFKIMEELSGHAIKIVTDPTFVRRDDPRVIVGSPLRLEALVGPLPNPEFRETLLRMYQAYPEKTAGSR
jgi:GDP-6-deoxy-D-talose 4-dehydrogenase